MLPVKKVSHREWIIGAACAVSLLVLFTVSPAQAKLCGDDVQGQDVPCACGDTLVSGVVLSDDPVTTTGYR